MTMSLSNPFVLGVLNILPLIGGICLFIGILFFFAGGYDTRSGVGGEGSMAFGAILAIVGAAILIAAGIFHLFS